MNNQTATRTERFSDEWLYVMITGEEWETPTYWPTKTREEADKVRPTKGKTARVMTAADAREFEAEREVARLKRVAETPLAKALARAEAAELKLSTIRAMATQGVPNCVNLAAIDRIINA